MRKPSGTSSTFTDYSVAIWTLYRSVYFKALTIHLRNPRAFSRKMWICFSRAGVCAEYSFLIFLAEGRREERKKPRVNEVLHEGVCWYGHSHVKHLSPRLPGKWHSSAFIQPRLRGLTKPSSVCTGNFHHSFLSLDIHSMEIASLQRHLLQWLAKPDSLIQVSTINPTSLFICE